MLARAGVSAAAACTAVGRVRGADQPLLCWASLPEPAPQASTMPQGAQLCLMVVSKGGRRSFKRDTHTLADKKEQSLSCCPTRANTESERARICSASLEIREMPTEQPAGVCASAGA